MLRAAESANDTCWVCSLSQKSTRHYSPALDQAVHAKVAADARQPASIPADAHQVLYTRRIGGLADDGSDAGDIIGALKLIRNDYSGGMTSNPCARRHRKLLASTEFRSMRDSASIPRRFCCAFPSLASGGRYLQQSTCFTQCAGM
jgi:hypothetical protein